MPTLTSSIPVIPSLSLSGTMLLSRMGIQCSTWLSMSVAERTNRLLMALYPGRNIKSLNKSEYIRLQQYLGSTDNSCINNGAALLAGMRMTCGEWLSLGSVERTRRLLVAFWYPLQPGMHI